MRAIIKKEFFVGVLAGVALVTMILGFAVGFDKIARAVTFDSDIVPISGSSMRVGVAPGQIKSINNTLFFDGQSVAIGTSTVSTSTVRLEISGGGLRLNNLTATSTCDTTTRGTLWFVPGTTGVKDSLAVCYRDSTGVFKWADFRGK